MSRKQTLFYSKKCPHCAEILNKIRMAPQTFGSSFEYILIDGNRNLPNFLKEVPTLIVPSHPQPLTGESVFMWIDTQMRMLSNKSKSASASAPGGGGGGDANSSQKKEGAIANTMDGLSFYNPLEMSGFGDNYFSLENDNGGQDHCFVFIDEKGNKQVQCTPQQTSGQVNFQAYNANQFNQQPQQQQQQSRPQQHQMPDWLTPQNVSRNNEQQPKSNQQMAPNNSMTMSQQNNIRLQQEARGLPPMMNFQDPQRAGMNENNKLTDTDYERYMTSRESDSRISSAPQRI